MHVNALLAALFLAGAAIGIGWWLARGRSRRVESFLSTDDSVAAHLVMNLGMAVMATPLYTAGVRGALIGIIGSLGAYFALRLVTRRGELRACWAADAYHLLAAAAMVFAIVLMPGGHPTNMEMAEHDMSGVPAAGVVAGVLAVLFALDAVGTTMLVAFAPARVAAMVPAPARDTPAPSGLPAVDRRDLRIAAVSHVIMDVGMVWMLLA